MSKHFYFAKVILYLDKTATYDRKYLLSPNSVMFAYIVMVFMVISAITYLKITVVAGCLSSVRDTMGYASQAQFFHENKRF